MYLCLSNRIMTMFLTHRIIHIINLVVLISSIVVSFSNIVNSSSRFRKVPSPIYYKLQGSDLELSCISEKTEGVTCFWLKGTNVVAPLPGKYDFALQPIAGDCSLKISNLELLRDNGQWICQASISSETETVQTQWPSTNVVVLVKPSQPNITFEFENFTDSPIADEITNISCQSSGGNPIPRLEWYLDDLNITRYSKESVDNHTIKSKLSYTFKKKDKGSRLTCLASHQTGQQFVTKTLNVQYKPYVSVKQKMYTVFEGSNLEIECHVEANPEANIYWKPGWEKIDNSKYKVVNNKLLLRNIDHNFDDKEFQCSAQNTVGPSKTESVKLNVLYPPRLLETLHPRKNVTVGEDIRFECTFAGNPKPKIRWSFTDAIYNNLYFPKPSLENAGILLIRNATYLNEGSYYCEGINYNSLLNKENIRSSNKFSVNIVGKPLFINDKKTVIGYRGLDTKIEQSFCSDPPPEKVYWIYGSNRIDVDPVIGNPKEDILDQHIDRFHIKTGRLIKIDSLSPNPTCFRVALMVTNTDTEDIRDYILAVHNKYGKTEGIVTLQVNSPLSIAAVIAFALIMLVIVLTITIGIILLRRRSSSSHNHKQQFEDPEIEEKSEVQVPNNDSYDQKKKNGH